MGCDIHLYVEARDRRTDAWRTADRWTQKYADEEGLSVANEDSFFSDRCYALFAALGGVRNYLAITPIAEPRGLPLDACAAVYDACRRWGLDGHSHSWLLLAELLAHNWDGPAGPAGHLLRSCIGGFADEVVPRLAELGEPENVRIVFWFDN